MKEIYAFAFSRCGDNLEIYYEGTISDWNSIKIDTYWYDTENIITVICSDGVIICNEGITQEFPN